VLSGLAIASAVAGRDVFSRWRTPASLNSAHRSTTTTATRFRMRAARRWLSACAAGVAALLSASRTALYRTVRYRHGCDRCAARRGDDALIDE
jgi:hypothetical protein